MGLGPDIARHPRYPSAAGLWRHPKLTTPCRRGHATILYSESDFDMALERADIAFLGIPFGSGYSFAK
jgi:hypothetical protein